MYFYRIGVWYKLYGFIKIRKKGIVSGHKWMQVLLKELGYYMYNGNELLIILL